MVKKAIILKDKYGNQLYPATYKDDAGNVIRDTYQETLVSGENIKTINNQTVLGSGNLSIYTESSKWGNITGDIEDQEDLTEKMDSLPNFLEYANSSSFPETGEEGKLYLATDTKKLYKWDEGSSETAGSYVNVGLSESVSIGSTAPSETGILWIDTGNNNGLKYYNGTSWVAVPVLFG